MLGLLAEGVRMPSFPEGEVRLAQANALQGLRAQEAQPGFKAERALAQIVYGGHPYAIGSGHRCAHACGATAGAHAAQLRSRPLHPLAPRRRHLC